MTVNNKNSIDDFCIELGLETLVCSRMAVSYVYVTCWLNMCQLIICWLLTELTLCEVDCQNKVFPFLHCLEGF